jgi:hypothetical protein
MSIPVLIRQSFTRCWLVVALQLGAACAQGYASEPPQAIEVPVVDAGHAVFTGEACTIGDRQPCSCPLGGSGLRACVPDSTSPTGGALTGCLPCDTAPSYAAGHGAEATPATGQSSSAVTEPPAAGKPAVSNDSGGSGGGGRGGGASAGASNAAGKGGAGGKTAASAGGGAGGSGGKAAAGGGGGGRSSVGTTSGGTTSGGSKSCSSDCAAQLCFPLGVLGCCKSNGTCGCTWVPGAYCM